MARDLKIYYLFRLLSTSYLFAPIWVLFAREHRGLDFVDIGLLNTIYSLVVIFTEVPTGAIADRFGRRWAMTAGALAMVAASLMFFFGHGFAAFAVAQALAALSMTLTSGADSAYLFDMLDDHGRRDEYARHEGTASAWHQAGQTLAFAAGGALFALGPALPFLATAGVAAVAFVVALGMREERLPLRTAPLTAGEYVSHMRASMTTVARRPQLMWAIAYSAIVFVLLRATIDVYQPYLKSAGFGAVQMGLIFAAVYAIAAAVAHRADWLRRRFAEPVLLFVMLGALGLTLLLLAGTSGPLCLLILVVQAPANGLYSPLVKPLLNREIEDSRRRATVLSVESMVRRAALGLAWPAIGWLMQRHGPSAGLFLCGVLGVLGLGALVAARGAALGAAASAPPLAPAGEKSREAA